MIKNVRNFWIQIVVEGVCFYKNEYSRHDHAGAFHLINQIKN